MSLIQENIEARKVVLHQIKTELIHRLHIQKTESQIDDDTALFGNGLKLDSVDATEILVLLDKLYGIQVSESDDPSFMRTVNNLASFVIKNRKPQ